MMGRDCERANAGCGCARDRTLRHADLTGLNRIDQRLIAVLQNLAGAAHRSPAHIQQFGRLWDRYSRLAGRRRVANWQLIFGPVFQGLVDTFPSA